MGGRDNSNAEVTTDRSIVTNVTIGTEHNAPLVYATGVELRHPIIIKLEGNIWRLER